MAIYHFSAKPISRSKGQSAVACAAYRAAERLRDETYGKMRDYTRKRDVVYTEILLPQGAPVWMSDRATLWNAVEFVEKRKDAQLAREFDIALPRELTLAQSILLAREFVQAAFVDKGMVADLCIHQDRMPTGEYQPHIHVMLTLREVTAEGFGQKVRSWNSKANLLLWREAWAETANRHLALHGHDLRIDHRTLVAQGIDLEPQYKIGASVAKDRLARLADHQRIARENGERLLADPTIALHAITAQQSTFTPQDIARFVNRHTVDADQFEQVYAKVKGCEALVYLGQDSRGVERFTTKEMLSVEQQMVRDADTLSQRWGHSVEGHVASAALMSISLTDEQRLAFDHVVEGKGLCCVVGYAGTGKSTLLGAARQVWEAQGYRVLGATLSGIAAEGLSGSSGIESRTLASRFYYWERGEQLLGSRDVLVVDEAGMVGSRQMARVLEMAAAGCAKVVLVGDPEQLQAIAAFRAISERVGTVELTDIRRQQVDWQKAATRELATGKTTEALIRYRDHHHVHAFETSAFAQQALLEQWNAARIRQPEKTQIILAYLRKEVQALNDLARQLRRNQGELGVDCVFKTERGERLFAEQDRIYFLKNDRDLGVMNGTLGTIIDIQGTQLNIRLDQNERQPHAPSRVIGVDTQQYSHVEHGYAATIHKAQGVTADRSYVLASQYLDRHATYTALSRHRECVDIFYSQDAFVQERDLFQVLSRERAKDTSLDYTIGQDFASQRGIEGLSEHRDSIRVQTDPSDFSWDDKVHQAPSDRAFREAALSRVKSDYEKPPEKAHALASNRPSDVCPEESLDALFKRYVELQLEQTRLTNEMHSSYLKNDPELRKACSQKLIVHDKHVIAFSRDAMKREEVQVIAEQIKSQKVAHIAELGGFEGIAKRLKQGQCSEQDRQVLTRHLQHKSHDRFWSRDRARDRGGRSR